MPSTGLTGLRIPEWVIWVSSRDAVFVLDTSTRDPRPVVVGGGGRLIWELLGQGEALTAGEIVDRLVDSTGEAAEVIGDETDDFLRDALERGLLIHA